MEGKKAGRKAVNDEDTKEMIPCWISATFLLHLL
jgi:hypothetical protein